MKTKKRRKVSVLSELEEMYARANEWGTPYDDYPGEWSKDASRVACLIIAKIMRLIRERRNKK